MVDEAKPESRPPFDVPADLRIAGEMNGIDLVVTVRLDRVSRLDAIVRQLRQMGLRQNRPLKWEHTADGLPICPRHHVPMRRREKQGDEWQSHKVIAPDGEVLYCRGYPGPDSLGYRVAPERGGEVGT